MRTITNWSTTLSASVTSSQTTLPLTSIETSDDTKVTITMSLFGDQASAYMVIEPSSSKRELIKFTGITDNGDGSGTLTGVTRGLAFSGTSETGVSANRRAHQAGSKIILSNVHYWYDQLVDRYQTETIAGVKTFSSVPRTTGGDPLSDNELARKAYVDDAATGSSTANRIIVAGTAGETVADGDLIYFDDTDNEWKLCDADTAATVNNVLLGIAQGAGTNGNAITNGVLIWGLDDAQSGMTAGDIMYASNTAGGISSSAGTVEVTIGIARTATELYFAPRFNQQLTEDQQDALAGSSGTPSSSNTFVTTNDVSDSGGSGRIIRASVTTVPAGIVLRPKYLSRDEDSQGSILYRSASRWTQLVAGTNQQILVTQGAGANPIWATRATAKIAAVEHTLTQHIIGQNQDIISRTILANTLGANGIIEGRALISNEATTAGSLSLKFGGSTLATISIDQTTTEQMIFITLCNRNATNAQVGSLATFNNAGTVVSDIAFGTSSVDTTQNQTLEIDTAESGGITFEYCYFKIITP